MRFAVATHSFLSLFTVDDSWEIVDHRRLHTGHHYGIAVDRERGRMYAKVNDRDLGELTEEILLDFDLDAPERPRRRIPLRGWLNDVHQACWANGGIYLANTAYNSIVYQTLEPGPYDEYFFDGVRHDRNHVNSVFPCGERIFVVLHNANTEGMSEVAQLRHSPGEGFELETRCRLWHQGCHNVYIEPPHLLYNASNVGAFTVVDLEQQTRIASLSFPGHTKGMAVTPAYVFIGFSDHAERHERPTSDGHLSVIARDDWRHLAEIDLNVEGLPHSIGNVNEVRRLDGVDLAHARSGAHDADLRSVALADRNPLRRWGRGLDTVRARIEDGVSCLTGERRWEG